MSSRTQSGGISGDQAGVIKTIPLGARRLAGVVIALLSVVLCAPLCNLFKYLCTMHPSASEIFPIVDEAGNIIGTAPRNVCHNGKSFLLHPVVHLHVFNTRGELFLQKRSMSKDIQPGKWDTSVGGHVAVGENAEEAVKREASEELGLRDFEPVFSLRYIWKSQVERELVSTFIIITDVLPAINEEEIDEGRFWSIQEISAGLGNGIFTPNFEHEFILLQEKRFFSL